MQRPMPEGTARGSLARRIQVHIGLIIALVIVAGTVLSYGTAITTLQSETIAALQSSTAARAAYESGPFIDAQVNTVALRSEYLQRLDAMGQQDPSAGFDALFARAADGVVRVRPELDDHTRRPSVYIRPPIELDAPVRRHVLAAYQLLAEWGPAMTHNFYSAYIDLPGISLIMYSPSVNWGKEADATTNNFDYPPVQLASPQKNPTRTTDWSEIYFDDKARIWMLSAITPVDYQGRWLAAVSQDIPVDDLIKRTTNQFAPGTYNMIIDKRGSLIAHPDLMEKIRKSNGNLKISALGDELLAGFARTAAAANAAEYGARVEPSADGAYYLAISDIRGPEWRFVTVYPKSLLQAKATRTAQDIAMVGVMLLLIEWLALSVIVRRLVSRPLVEMGQAASAIAGGNMDVALPNRYHHELGRFAAEFTGMAQRLRGRDLALQVRTKELEAEVAERREAERRMAHMATHDALTGLANRTLLNDRLQQAISHAARSGQQVAVLFIDLDNFKHINDTLGHDAGDEVLRQVAARIGQLCRKSDTLCRLGGDEFVLLLPAIADQDDAVRVARNVIASVTAPMSIDGLDCTLTPSIGIASHPADGLDGAALMGNADIAMYRAKAAGKNGYQCYTPDMGLRASEALRLEAALRQAIVQEELELHYQPKVNAATFKVSGAEALLRWRRPGVGLLTPIDFVPFAEKNRIIGGIDRYVLHGACRQLAAWRDSGCHPLPLAVNLSAGYFAGAQVLAEIAALIGQYRIEPGQLTLEVTEGVLLQEVHLVADNLAGLRRMGLRISIDDFGTGFSSLSYMHRFPIDEIKIDRSFVNAIQAADDKAPLVRAVVRMADDLGISVVAEGVETAVQAAHLQALACDELQGYHFFRPLDQATFTQLLRSQAANKAESQAADKLR
jgi:diguanylate cyclase (GGDEF)-like protein